jgi:hypothetical protein
LWIKVKHAANLNVKLFATGSWAVIFVAPAILEISKVSPLQEYPYKFNSPV